MSPKNHKEDWREKSEQHSVSPRDAAWDRLEAKLDKESLQKKGKLKVLRFRILTGIAATVTLMFCAVIVLQLNKINKYERPRGQVESMEGLDSTSDYFYSVRNARRAQKNFPQKKTPY